MTVVPLHSPSGRELALRQLSLLGYQDGDRAALTAFYPTGHPDKDGDVGRKAYFEIPRLPVSDIQQWQAEGRGVYLVINPGGHKKADTTHGFAIFYEHDQLTPEISQDLWRGLGLPEPTFQVSSGGKSIHSYWVLDKPCTVAEWEPLQADLLEYADADRSLKNCNRVMRLAGCKNAATGRRSELVTASERVYPYEALRKAIPCHTPAPESITWATFEQQWSPSSDGIPLELCLTKAHRDYLQRGVSANRNDSGAALARDLIGTANYLQTIGQAFDGDPYALFVDYCRNCVQGNGWNQAEWDAIWKSALSKKPGAALSPEGIEACIKSYQWKQQQPEQKALNPLQKVQEGGYLHPNDEIPQEGEETPEEIAKSLDEAVDRLAAIDLTEFDSWSIYQAHFLAAMRRFRGLRTSVLQQRVEEVRRRGESTGLITASDLLDDTFTEIEQRASGMILPGIPSGFIDIDAMTQGFQPSDLIIVAARPSMGKSSFVLNVAKNVVQRHKMPVAFFSLEMSKQQLTYKLISDEVSIETSRLRTGRIAPHEWEPLGASLQRLSACPLSIDDTPNPTVGDIRGRCKKFQVEAGGALGLIIIDYLQLIGSADENRVQELSKITRALKGLGRELNVPIISLSQLSRGCESRTNKRPMMSDLRESGSIEQDADLIMMLYREEYYDPDTADRGITEINIVKHRNGPTGTVKLLFEPQFTRFRNLAAA
jgi:replicative DNA helicase